MEEFWERSFLPEFALGAKFERIYRGEQCFKQLTQPVCKHCRFFLAC